MWPTGRRSAEHPPHRDDAGRSSAPRSSHHPPHRDAPLAWTALDNRRAGEGNQVRHSLATRDLSHEGKVRSGLPEIETCCDRDRVSPAPVTASTWSLRAVCYIEDLWQG